jgi:hypothetical protein
MAQHPETGETFQDFKTGDLVTVQSFPGVWKVNQPLDREGFAHLVASDDAATAYMADKFVVSLIVHSRVCKAHTAVVVDVMTVVESHGGYVRKVSNTDRKGWFVLHLAFRNVAAKQHFGYAIATAHKHITMINRPGTVQTDIVVPFHF